MNAPAPTIPAHPTTRSRRRGVRTAALAAAGLTGVLLLSACGSPGGDGAAENEGDPTAPEVAEITIAAIAGPAAAPLWAAAETGIGEEYGLTITPSWVGNAGIAVTSVISGDAQAGSTSYFGVIDAINQGMDLTVVAESYSSTPGTGSLEALPDSGIEEVADLIGKKVNVVSLNSSHIIKLSEQLIDAGLDPEDVDWVELPYGEVAAALEQGSVEASSAVGAALAAAKGQLGTQTVFDYGGDPYEGLAEAGFVMSKRFVTENPNTAAAIQCTISKANQAVLDDRALYERYLTEELGMSAEAAAADVMLTYEPGLRVDSLQANADLYQKTGRIDEAFSFADNVTALPEQC